MGAKAPGINAGFEFRLYIVPVAFTCTLRLSRARLKYVATWCE